MADEMFLLVANPVRSVVGCTMWKRVCGVVSLTHLSCSDL